MLWITNCYNAFRNKCSVTTSYLWVLTASCGWAANRVDSIAGLCCAAKVKYHALSTLIANGLLACARWLALMVQLNST